MKLTQGLPTNLPALSTNFIPGAIVHFHRTVAKLSRQSNDFRDDELGNTPGITERGVEDRDTMLSSVLEIYLIGTNAKAPNHK